MMQPKDIKNDYILPEEGSQVAGEVILQLAYLNPPTTYAHNVFQPSNPCDINRYTHELLYPTFHFIDFQWVYVGLHPEKK